MKQNNLKARMQRGETVYGMFLNSGSSIAAEIMGLSGFDFILIDSEHGPTGVLENRELIMAAEYRNTVPIVRIPNGSSDTILRMLDVGAHGILVPRVNTKEEAEKVAKACRYFPRGTRGVAGARASDYGFTPLSYYFPLANERTLVGVQCEDIACLPNLEDIAATDGIDMIFVGPYDLSSSMGTLGQVSYQNIKDVVDRVIDVTRRRGKLSGIFTKDAAEAKQYAKMGINFITVGTDIQNFAGACRGVMSELKEM